MFIKILTPNHNGKIELTVRDLEALIEEAVEKAIREKCSNCNRGYYGGITYLNSTPSINLKSSELGDAWKPYVTCSAENVSSNTLLSSKVNEMLNKGE